MPRLNEKYWKNYHKHPMYKCWHSIIQRYTQPKQASYKNYGGRGVKVCDRWMDFRNFIIDLHDVFHLDLQIDRINNEGDYEPTNVRFVTPSENCRNRRSNKMITLNGVTKCFQDWCNELGLKRGTVKERIRKYGWTVEQAFELEDAPKRVRNSGGSLAI